MRTILSPIRRIVRISMPVLKINKFLIWWMKKTAPGM
ncbi:N-acetylmuramyl-L-alanine amidase, negative regulator of AmpC, AmpD, partial [Candidatus Regiella insecticola 5.15]